MQDMGNDGAHLLICALGLALQTPLWAALWRESGQQGSQGSGWGLHDPWMV